MLHLHLPHVHVSQGKKNLVNKLGLERKPAMKCIKKLIVLVMWIKYHKAKTDKIRFPGFPLHTWGKDVGGHLLRNISVTRTVKTLQNQGIKKDGQHSMYLPQILFIKKMKKTNVSPDYERPYIITNDTQHLHGKVMSNVSKYTLKNRKKQKNRKKIMWETSQVVILCVNDTALKTTDCHGMLIFDQPVQTDYQPSKYFLGGCFWGSFLVAWCMRLVVQMKWLSKYWKHVSERQ